MNKVQELSELAQVSTVTVYSRIREIYKSEHKYRLPTLAELKKRNSGRPKKFDY